MRKFIEYFVVYIVFPILIHVVFHFLRLLGDFILLQILILIVTGILILEYLISSIWLVVTSGGMKKFTNYKKTSLILLLSVIIGLSNPYPFGSFLKMANRDDWNSEVPYTLYEKPSKRRQMLFDVVRTHVIGKPKKEVKKFFGEKSDRFSDKTGQSLTYWVDDQDGGGVDSYWITIRFKNDGSYESFNIWID